MMGNRRWSERIVAELYESSLQDLPFKFAWANAIQRHPFIAKEFGILGEGESLFDGEGESLFDQRAHETFMWYRRVCEMAYVDAPAPSGGPSRLRGLHAALEMDLSALTDRHVPVRKTPRPFIAA